MPKNNPERFSTLFFFHVTFCKIIPTLCSSYFLGCTLKVSKLLVFYHGLRLTCTAIAKFGERTLRCSISYAPLYTNTSCGLSLLTTNKKRRVTYQLHFVTLHSWELCKLGSTSIDANCHDYRRLREVYKIVPLFGTVCGFGFFKRFIS